MTEKFAAIVLAGGFSSRMGKFKPLLPLGETTILERILLLLKVAGVDDIRVVMGHRANEVMPLLERLRVIPVVNKRFREGMFSSVAAGVVNLGESCEAFFVFPVDIPLVRRQTLLDIMRAYKQDNRKNIIYPAFCGERGHPPLISASYRDMIARWHGEGGLKALLREHDEEAADVEVVDEYILCDLDTPDDYRRIAECWKRYEIPTIRECETLLRRFAVKKRVWDHSLKVAQLACCIARELNDVGSQLDLALIEAGALLHDLARGRKNHAEAGAAIIRDMGFPDVADIVSSHMDITRDGAGQITARDVVYLADKLVEGDKHVALEDRFQMRIKLYGDNPALRKQVLLRMGNALTIKRSIEKQLGRSLEVIFGKNGEK